MLVELSLVALGALAMFIYGNVCCSPQTLDEHKELEDYFGDENKPLLYEASEDDWFFCAK